MGEGEKQRCNAAGLEAVSKIREVVYQEPHPVVVETTGEELVSKYAGKERDRRNTERGLYQELSRYLRVDTGYYWTRPGVLANRKHGRWKCDGDRSFYQRWMIRRPTLNYNLRIIQCLGRRHQRWRQSRIPSGYLVSSYSITRIRPSASFPQFVPSNRSSLYKLENEIYKVIGIMGLWV